VLFSPLKHKHWQKYIKTWGWYKINQHKNCWRLFQKAFVSKHSHKRGTYVSCAVWQKQQIFDSENRNVFVEIRLCRNLNWKFLSSQSLINFVWQCIWVGQCLACWVVDQVSIKCSQTIDWIKGIVQVYRLMILIDIGT